MLTRTTLIKSGPRITLGPHVKHLFQGHRTLPYVCAHSRRTFFNSSAYSSSSSSSSSFNFSAQPNGYSTNSGDLESIFKYNIAVSHQPKDRESEKGALYQQIAKVHDSTSSPTGEDNYLVGVNFLQNSVIVGVADGVGGWSELGFDSSAISRELCKALRELFEQAPAKDNNIKLLNDAFTKVLHDGIVEVGGTTICFGVIDQEGKLTATNLGDSWFGVFRPFPVSESSRDLRFKCVFQSQDQTHGFNTPYQLSIIPQSLQDESAKQGKKYLQDYPNDADKYDSFSLQRNDVVLFATDGVTDNVCPEDIALFLTDEFDKRSSKVNEVALLNLAKDFVGKVNALSQDHQYPSVFAQNLSKLINQKYTGGKYDDITVVMVHVV